MLSAQSVTAYCEVETAVEKAEKTVDTAVITSEHPLQPTEAFLFSYTFFRLLLLYIPGVFVLSILIKSVCKELNLLWVFSPQTTANWASPVSNANLKFG